MLHGAQDPCPPRLVAGGAIAPSQAQEGPFPVKRKPAAIPIFFQSLCRGEPRKGGVAVDWAGNRSRETGAAPDQALALAPDQASSLPPGAGPGVVDRPSDELIRVASGRGTVLPRCGMPPERAPLPPVCRGAW